MRRPERNSISSLADMAVVGPPTRFDFVVNLKTAKALGLGSYLRHDSRAPGAESY
jgi:hypothetical protein